MLSNSQKDNTILTKFLWTTIKFHKGNKVTFLKKEKKKKTVWSTEISKASCSKLKIPSCSETKQMLNFS